MDWYYVGMTQDIIKRLDEHNKGRVKSTKSRRPYELVYIKKCGDRVTARLLERKLKNSFVKRRKLKSLYGDCSSIG